MHPIKHIRIEKGMRISDIIENMKESGFGARKLGEAADIFIDMIRDKDCKIFLGIAGAMVPAGMREIMLDLLDYTSVFVTTGANLTHDLIESLGERHYAGDEKEDDSLLNKKGLDRIYDVYMKNNVYPKLEKFFEANFEALSKCKNIKELLWKLGELVNGKGILGKCYNNKIPIFCPALADSGIGLMLWGRLAAGKKLYIDAFDDMKEIIDIAWTSKKNGVIYCGGGVPKNFIQQAMQFSKGASYGIQISTDRPEPGGSSGAPLKEGISWGKLDSKAKYVDVFCDATIALPMILSYAKERLN